MGMDRNTIIGFVLIGALLLAMFYFNSKNQLAFEGDKKRIADSIALVNKKNEALIQKSQVQKVDSNAAPFLNYGFQKPLQSDSIAVLENDKISVSFYNRGGQPGKAILKKYKTFDGKSVELNAAAFNKLSYRINTSLNKSADIANVIFSHQAVQKNADGSQSVVFEATDSSGKRVAHTYKLSASD